MCAVYSYLSFLQTVRMDCALERRPLLLARYGGPADPVPPAPWSRLAAHQYDGDGGERAPGGMDLDFNRSRLTLDELRAVLFAPAGP